MNFIKKIFNLILLLITIQSINAIELIKNNYITNIYGNIKINNLINKNNENNINKNNIFTFSIKNKIKKNNIINTFSKLEGNIPINIIDNNNKYKYNNININLAYIGIKHKLLGSISYGKNYRILHNTLYNVNILPFNNSKFIKSNISNEILNNIFTYKKKFLFKNNFIKNIGLIAQYQIKNYKNIINFNNGGWSIGYYYNTPNGINISASYSNQIYNKIKIKNNNKILIINKLFNKNSQIWSTSIKYNFENLYIASSYTKGINFTPIISTIKSYFYNEKINKYNYAKNSENIIIIIKYNLNSNIIPILSYIQTTVDNIEKIKIKNNIYTPNNIDLEKYFDLGIIYNFNKSLSGYIDYKINQMTNNNILKINNNNIVSIGLKYKL